MKKFKTKLLLLGSLIFLISCTTAKDFIVSNYSSLATSSITEDKNGTLSVSIYLNHEKGYTPFSSLEYISMLVFKNSYWVKIKNKTITIEVPKGIEINKNMYVLYDKNSVSLKDIFSRKILFVDTLPTNEEIISNLNIPIVNGYAIKYMPFLTKQFEWDRKKHIISIATNKRKSERGGFKYKLYYAYIYKDDSNKWNFQPIDDKYSYKFNEGDGIGAENSIRNATIPHHSLDGRANLCLNYAFANDDNGNELRKNRCFVLENGKVYLKDLFGEIYNIEYKNMLDNIYKNVRRRNYNYTFDSKGNMHLFYNKREDIVNDNYNYFWYGYFTKDDPTTPLYEQKILWR